MTNTITRVKKSVSLPREPGSKSPWRILTVPAQYLIWLLVFLLAVEVVLAFAGLGEEEIFALDRELGTRHMTDKSVTWRKEGYARSYFNHDGLREGALTKAKPAGTLRIALMGDSLVEGLQVPINETFGKELERKLSEELAQPVQVINFATSGYSTAQEYMQLQKQVLGYAPDLVLVGYNARDMFENWSPPDNTIANVRPLALKLPGKPLAVETGSIAQWMRTPRAKILLSIAWLRQHSRIWGLISAAETEASFHSETYKTLMALLNQPGKTSRALFKSWTDRDNWQKWSADTSASIKQYFATLFKSNTTSNITAPIAVAAKAPATATTSATKISKPVKPNQYVTLMTNTLEALYVGMDKQCQQKGARLMLVAMPSRAAILPISGMDSDVYGVDYRGEVAIVNDICSKNGLLYVDALSPALSFDNQKQQKLFYTAHMTQAGHQYLADRIYSPIKRYIDDSKRP